MWEVAQGVWPSVKPTRRARREFLSQASGPGRGAAFPFQGHEQPGSQQGVGICWLPLPSGTIQGGQGVADRIERQLQQDAQVLDIRAELLPEARVLGLDEALGGEMQQILVMC